MEIVKIIGIIALIVFLVAYIGTKVISWFALSGEIVNKIEEILEYVSTGSLTIGAVCGIIYLFS